MSPKSEPFELPQVAELSAQTGAGFARLVALMQRLLAEDGCPWDREQTKLTLRKYVVEEASEVIDAIDADDDKNLCEELGDLALQVAFLGELGRAAGSFGPDDVMFGICEKLVRRHPHVFHDAEAADGQAVERNWERIKAEEKGERALLAGIPRNLPALTRAKQIGVKVAAVGFDWPDAESSWHKVAEELQELKEAVGESQSHERVTEEFGDLLFALSNWARHTGIDPEVALRSASDKFTRRFQHVERRVKEQGGFPRDKNGKPCRGLPLAELDGYWNESKFAEKAGQED